jgi:cellulose synthase/poly-beta-1,6-N-acetylglucosamine synthase-like glycosyltransferase
LLAAATPDSARALAPARRPFVSLHVPICAEPPEVVANTLRALSRLDYDAFEVLVIDNNTRDELLWRPIEALCHELGSRFRFFHLESWPGFKAGALNFALEQTDAAATLVSVVDADFEVMPRFLAELAGHFEDENVAFVQTPQDYRDWRDNPFSRVCYWEYWQVFSVSMNLRNRWNAILMHGTMSIVRKDAVARVGGWAQWCLTEDSELGLRLLFNGARGIYVGKTYGRGLVPFTFRDYKRQRRRWVIGGVQQLTHHAAGFFSRRGGMSVTQSIHYLRWWLHWFRDGIVVASAPLCFVAALAALGGALDPVAFAPLAIGLLGVLAYLIVRTAVVYRLYLLVPWRDAAGAMTANVSLVWTIGCAWLAGTTNKRHVFNRTPKRPHGEPGWFYAAQAEATGGFGCLLLALLIEARLGLGGVWAIIALCAYTVFFLPAIWMAWLSGRRSETQP